MSVTAVPLRPIARSALAKLWFGVGVAVLIAAGAAWAGTSIGAVAGYEVTDSGLRFQVIKEGTGESPTDADVALVNYKGTLADGTVFDENQRTPLEVTGVVPGFSEALKRMKRGGRYKIVIPPELGYGAEARGPLPANATLTFDVDLIDFRSMAQIQAEMQQMQGAQGALVPPPGAPGPQPQR